MLLSRAHRHPTSHQGAPVLDMASNDVARFADAEAPTTLQQHITGKMATLQAA
jgi:hypothetical protein